jgi:poly-gamma-glutamate synthesis protein (capsule biosynthesis protein)
MRHALTIFLAGDVTSHHPRPIEIYRNKPIFYGCGDFINDYEGISGYSQFRGDLSLMYFPDFAPDTFKFQKLRIVPMQIKNFRLHLASEADTHWIWQTLVKISWNTHFTLHSPHEIWCS